MAEKPIKSSLEIDLSKSKAIISQVKAARATEEGKAQALQTKVRTITQRLAATEARARVLAGQVKSQIVSISQQFAVIGITELVSNISGELSGIAGSVIGIGTSAAFGFATLGPIGAAIGTLTGAMSMVFTLVKQIDQRIQALTLKQKQIEDRGDQFEKQFEEEAIRRAEQREELLAKIKEEVAKKSAELDYETWQMLP